MKKILNKTFKCSYKEIIEVTFACFVYAFATNILLFQMIYIIVFF